MESQIIGVSENLQQVRELIKHVADTGLNTVISGETGVGKELVAQCLYQNSSRVGKPFVKVNCAALPDTLLESELYGYERGAFTGAEKRKKGKFELSHGGVLFLDEIGDMSVPLQSKLLHVLQSGEFSPLGSEKDVKTDTWIMAATNHELEEDIKNKNFREDLFYRLNIIKIHIEPLRDRPEDIPHLINHYIDLYSSRYDGKNILKPDNSILEKLTGYHWPGNVRELQNILKRLLVVGNWEDTIEGLSLSVCIEADLPSTQIKPAGASVATDFLDLDGEYSPDLASFSLKKVKKQAVDKVEKEVISYVLKKTGWNRSKAAKILKISYKTLLYKICDLNLETPPDSNTAT